MLTQLRQLTEKICLESPKTDLSFWKAAYEGLPKSQTDHLCDCYCALIETLLGCESQAFNICSTQAGMPLLSEQYGPMCTLAQACEIAHLWQWLGSVRQDQNLQMAGARAEKLLEQLKAYPGILTQESQPTYIPPKDLYQSVPLSAEQMPEQSDPELGLCLHKESGMKIGLTAVGNGSGYGSILRRSVGILSFGPSLWPKEAFGLQLAPTDLNALSDHKPLPGFNVQRHGELLHYAAWSRLVCDQEHIWCELSAFCKKDMHLTWRFLDPKKYSFSMLFAARADALKIGSDLELASGSLKQYKGGAKTIALEGRDSQMVIIPSEQGKMEVIPLAKDSRYWGADFLIIYPLGPHASQLGWNIY